MCYLNNQQNSLAQLTQQPFKKKTRVWDVWVGKVFYLPSRPSPAQEDLAQCCCSVKHVSQGVTTSHVHINFNEKRSPLLASKSSDGIGVHTMSGVWGWWTASFRNQKFNWWQSPAPHGAGVHRVLAKGWESFYENAVSFTGLNSVHSRL